MTASRSELEELYRREDSPDVKERLLLILRVEGDGMVPARVAKELHRSRPWTSYWLERYQEEGVDGLRDKPRSGRPPKISAKVQLEIKRELSSRRQGWTTEQVAQLIAEKANVEYHFTHVYRLMHKWGFKEKVPQRRHVNTAPMEEKQDFKKRTRSS
jgi:putative transposase